MRCGPPDHSGCLLCFTKTGHGHRQGQGIGGPTGVVHIRATWRPFRYNSSPHFAASSVPHDRRLRQPTAIRRLRGEDQNNESRPLSIGGITAHMVRVFRCNKSGTFRTNNIKNIPHRKTEARRRLFSTVAMLLLPFVAACRVSNRSSYGIAIRRRSQGRQPQGDLRHLSRRKQSTGEHRTTY